jgi:predicted amidohydrolase
MRSIRVAAAQYPPAAVASLKAYEAKLKNWVEEAVAHEARLLVFPEYAAMELAAMGPATPDLNVAIDRVTALVPEIDRLHAGLAKQHGVTIVCGSFLERRDGRIRNVAHIFGPRGRKGRVEKLMPTPWERTVAHVESGRRPAAFDLGGVRVGLVICYDIEFPLISRALAEAGAEIILAPSNTETEWGYWRVRTGAMARALENQVYTVHSPTVGEAAEVISCPVNIGAAGIFAPSDRGFPAGGILTLGEMNRPQWIYATLDLDLLGEVRRTGGVQTYAHWPEQPGAGPLPKPAVIDIAGD